MTAQPNIDGGDPQRVNSIHPVRRFAPTVQFPLEQPSSLRRIRCPVCAGMAVQFRRNRQRSLRRIDGNEQQIRVFDFRSGVNISAKDQTLRNSSLPLVPHKRGFIGFSSQDEYQALFGDNFPLKLVAEIGLPDFLKFGSRGQEVEKP